MQCRGKVTRSEVSVGSKSEHNAVVLLTADGPLKLRRPGGNPFQDPVLEELVGKEIVCEGDVRNRQLFLTRWEIASAGD